MNSGRIVALIPAAGASQRLGTPKILVTLPTGQSVLAHAVQVARDAGLEVVVAVRKGAAAARAEASRAGAEVVEVDDPSPGISASLRAGATAIARDPEVSGILVLLADQWRVTPDDLQRLVAAWVGGGSTAAAAKYAGAMGVPALFGRTLFSLLREARGDAGARAFLRSPSSRVAFADLPNAAFDLDDPRDAEHARAVLK